MNNTGGGKKHWADETAEKVIREKGDKELYTCASGITPSGTVHIGNFREIISVDLVARALRDAGKRVRFIYSWDDYDVFRKVPANMPGREELARYLRYPITMVPDPWGRDESYARHHEVDVEAALPRVGIYPEFLYQAANYRASRYAAGIRRALEHKDALRAIHDAFRDEEHKITGEWWPVAAFCAACHRDNTEIEGWDGEWTLSYHCDDCGHSARADLRASGEVKLVWRVDWPMRWDYEKVDFEPAGKDHHSQGGSFDTARRVSKEVYGRDAPVTFRYDFIGIKGRAGKMSSSSGEVVNLTDLLRVYTPEVARYLFAGTRPNTEFTISFDLDVIKIYEDYDRTERVAWGIEAAKDAAAAAREKRIYELSQVEAAPAGGNVNPAEDGAASPTPPYQVPFRHLCNLVQIAGGDVERALSAPSIAWQGGAMPSSAQLPRLRARAECARYWVAECAPEEFRFTLAAPGSPRAPGLGAAECAGLALLRAEVAARIETFPGDRECAEAIYAAASRAGLEGKALFRAAYLALIGKDQGPRLANFLRSIEKERLLELLAAY